MYYRAPNQCLNLKAAQNALMKECHDMESMRKLEISDWQGLARDVRILKRERHQYESLMTRDYVTSQYGGI
jgi:hypothetical protein